MIQLAALLGPAHLASVAAPHPPLAALDFSPAAAASKSTASLSATLTKVNLSGRTG